MYEGVASSQTLYERKSSNHDLADNERCRICLDESGQLLSLPCLCKNELGRVHEKCLARWIQIQSPSSIVSSMTSTKCEICLKSIKVKIKSESRVRRCHQIKQARRTCEMISGFVAILVIFFLLYLCINGIINNVGKDSFIMYVVFGAVIIFLLVMFKIVIQLLLRIFHVREIVSLQFVQVPQDEKKKNEQHR